MNFRIFKLILLLVIIPGCITGEKEENSKDFYVEEVNVKEEINVKEEVNVMENISISAEAFKAGGTIPAEYTCEGDDISPMLTLEGIPGGTKSIALIMDDPDAPTGTFVHWVIYNIPADTGQLSRGIKKSQTLGDGSVQGKNDFRKVGYGGPCPPPGSPHRYYFKVYALDTKLDLSPGASKSEVENAMKGHILSKGELMGKFKR